MKKIFLIFFVLSPIAYAEDGVVIQFTIEEKIQGANSSQEYTNSVLMSLNESHTFDFENLYSVKFSTKSLQNSKINVVTTIKDLSSGKPYYVGANSTDLSVGSNAEFTFLRNNTNYKVTIDTSYGELP